MKFLNKILFYAIGIMLILIVLPNCIQGQKKVVLVTFSIDEVEYINTYGQNEIAIIEQAGADSLAKYLNLNYSYLSFKTNEGSINLHCSIDREKTSLTNAFIHQVDLSLFVKTNIEPSPFLISSIFREKEQYVEDLPVSKEGFLAILVTRIKYWFTNEREKIIEQVMSQVSLAEKAYPDSASKCWVLPFAEDELGIGMSSKFLVKSLLETDDIEREFIFQATHEGKVPESSVLYPLDYRGKIRAFLEKNDEHMDMLGNPQLSIQGIYLLKYIQSNNILPVTPSDFDFQNN